MRLHHPPESGFGQFNHPVILDERIKSLPGQRSAGPSRAEQAAQKSDERDDNHRVMANEPSQHGVAGLLHDPRPARQNF